MNHQQEPTLTPADVPVETVARLADDHRRQAETIAQNARDRLAHGDTMGAVARYEAALARFQTAGELERKANVLAATIAATHAQRAKREHPWPNEHLANTTHVHRESIPHMPAEFHQAHPRWGVEVDNGDHDVQTFVSLTPAVEYGTNHGPASLILHVTEGTAGHPERVSGNSLSVRISGEQWDALNSLAQRISDRVPVPYDEHGNTRIQQQGR